MIARPARRATAITSFACVGVGIDDRNAVRRQQLGEQAQLGGKVGLHARMIVEVIVAEIGEGRGFQLDAVEPVLVEAVRGGFEGQMRDAVAAPAAPASDAA